MAGRSLPPFAAFLDDHGAPVRRFLVASAGAVEADDLWQETMIAALRAYPDLRPDSNLRAWVLTIARRKAIDAGRAQARRPVPVAAVEERIAAREPGLGAGPDVWSAARDLPEGQRHALALRFAADLSYEEIGAALDCSAAAARRRVADAVATLRARLATPTAPEPDHAR